MANTLKIREVTIAQLCDPTNTVNTINPLAVAGVKQGRAEALGIMVVRVTDSVADDSSETGSDADKMALFESKGHGHPWTADKNKEDSVVSRASAGTGATLVATFTGTELTGITITNGGTGFKVGDQLPVRGGTNTQEGYAIVSSVGANGVLTGVTIARGGNYSVTSTTVNVGQVVSDSTVIYPAFDYSTF
jgi:hypothetical protein